MSRYGVILAARTGSHRLPGKALLPLKELPMIVFLIRRLKTSTKVNRIILATTKLMEDDILAELAKTEEIDSFRGDTDDVVLRFVEAAHAFKLEYVVRVTGDCPFVDGPSLDYCLAACDRYDSFDIASTKKRFPVGIDYEVYNAWAMRQLHSSGLSPEEREHLTLGMYNHPEQYKTIPLFPPADWPQTDTEFTVDSQEDYLFAQAVTEAFDSIFFSVPDLIAKAKTV